MPEISREDLLALLGSMGVSLPLHTKIPEEDLQKRLSNALDAAQQLNATFDSTPVIPSGYPAWPSKTNLLDATKRGNYQEALQNSLHLGPMGLSTEKQHTFREMRQIVMAFGNYWQQDKKELCLMDKSMGWAVYVRVSKSWPAAQIPCSLMSSEGVARIFGQGYPPLHCRL